MFLAGGVRPVYSARALPRLTICLSRFQIKLQTWISEFARPRILDGRRVSEGVDLTSTDGVSVGRGKERSPFVALPEPEALPRPVQFLSHTG